MKKRPWKKKTRYFLANRQKKLMRILMKKKKAVRVRGSGKTTFYCMEAFELLEEVGYGKKGTLRVKGGKKIVTIPRVFSVSENPEETLKTFEELFVYGKDILVCEIEIDHSNCIDLEIAASTIMDVIILSIREYRRRKKVNLIFSGQIPAQGRVKDVFMASGLAAHLDINLNNQLSYDKNAINRFKLISGKHTSSEDSKAATKLGMYISDCLKTQGFELTSSGLNIISVLFSEVLDNCKIHAGKKSVWYTLGHFQLYENQEHGEMQIVIFDLGNTIYQQMNSENVTDETKEILLIMESCHKKYFSNSWDKEALYTLLSLQEGISRLRDKNVAGNKKRGVGTIRLIENFQKIGHSYNGKDPLMTITSGHTQIVFDGKYRLNQERIESSPLIGERKIIAFNNKNNIMIPPDITNVKKLGRYFPGTIISLKFFLDKKYLTKLLSN